MLILHSIARRWQVLSLLRAAGGPFYVPLFTVLLDFGVKAAAALSSAVVTGARRSEHTP